MVMALLIGLGGGSGLAFFLHFLDDRIRSHEDIRSIAPYPFLTFIPDREKEGKNGEDIIANAFKTLREFIFMNQKSTLLAQSLLVTSASPDEGKTFVAIHLALSLARAQKRVLLIDADLYRGPIARILRVPRRPGLIDLLLDPENLYTLNDFPQVNEYLTVVPHGVSDRSSWPRPERLDLQGVLARFATAFDYIIIDALPVLSMAEAVQLVSQVDGVLLVVRSDSTTRSVLRTAVELLEKVHAPVTGVVLNRVNLKSRYSYYRYYHSYYQYYSRYQVQTG
jgi:capsular exopolysaccharide synthesis family protein